MLYRPKFVTNSSTSSYLVYGVNVTREEIERLLVHFLLKIDVHKFIADNKQNFKEINLLEYDNPETLAADICEIMMDDEPEEWVRELSGNKLEAVLDYEGDYDSYLGINRSFDTYVEGDKVILTEITAEDYDFLQTICDELDLKDKDIGFCHWAHYS